MERKFQDARRQTLTYFYFLSNEIPNNISILFILVPELLSKGKIGVNHPKLVLLN